MDIRQLELFIAAAEEQHFTRAARRENIVQSGLSVSIRALEEELGTLLFVRSTRRVELSEAGRIFLPEARRVLLAATAARNAVAAVKEGLIGRLSIGTVQSLTPFFDLPALLQEFRLRYPQVDITVRETYLDAIGDALRDGSLDLAFMPITGGPRPGLSFDRLFSTPMVLAMSSRHPLAHLSTVSLHALSDEVFVDFSPRWGTRELVDQIFMREGVARQTAFEVENFSLLLQFVSRGFGMAVVPRAMVQDSQFKCADIVPTHPGNQLVTWDLGMFRAKTGSKLSPNPPADVFRKMVEETVRG